MSIESLTEGAREAGRLRRSQTVGESFIAVAPTEALAREVGPLLAEAIRPARIWGRVLHVEQIDVQRWEVVVEDRGARQIGRGF